MRAVRDSKEWNFGRRVYRIRLPSLPCPPCGLGRGLSGISAQCNALSPGDPEIVLGFELAIRVFPLAGLMQYICRSFHCRALAWVTCLKVAPDLSRRFLWFYLALVWTKWFLCTHRVTSITGMQQEQFAQPLRRKISLRCQPLRCLSVRTHQAWASRLFKISSRFFGATGFLPE